MFFIKCKKKQLQINKSGLKKFHLDRRSSRKMDKFEITDEILKLCLYGNLIKDKVSIDGKIIGLYLNN